MSEQDKLKSDITRILKSFPEIQVASLFGSAAHNRLNKQSDLDIAVAGESELSFDLKTEIMIRLSIALSREVDLIDMHQVSGTILQQVLCTGDFLLKNSPGILAGLIKKMWYNQADMMPLSERIQKEQIRRFING